VKLSPPDSRRSLLLLVLGLTALRLAAAGTIHLTEDEAYYRLWAQHLQFGYLDHPPMIAWWIRAGEALFGDTALGVRFLPVLACGLNSWLIGDLTRRLGADDRTAFRATLWYNATLTVCLGGMLALPDAPASLFWTLTLWALARVRAQVGAQVGARSQTLWWLAAGAAAGLAVLSKYSGLFLAPGVLLWLVAIPGGRDELRKPGPWAAAAIAAAIFAVNIAWNAQHHWITFAKQFGRVAPHGIAPGHVAELIGEQILLFTPLLAVFAVLGIRQAWRERGDPAAVQLMLPLATAAPFAAYLVFHSLHDRVQAHWPVPLFGAFAICAAVAAARLEGRGWTILRRLAPALGYAAAAGAFAIAALPTPNPLGGLDPTLALRGWPQFAAQVEAVRARTGAAWVGTESYGVFSQLDLEHRSTPLLEVVERDRYWPDDPDRPDFSRPGLVVDLARRMKVFDVQRCFTSVTPVAELRRAGSPGRNQRYSAFLVSGPKRDVWTRGCPDQVEPGVWR
jgi:4-amino-4-deoxy-L-arabinose transferase-like glycosyltransferase